MLLDTWNLQFTRCIAAAYMSDERSQQADYASYTLDRALDYRSQRAFLQWQRRWGVDTFSVKAMRRQL